MAGLGIVTGLVIDKTLDAPPEVVPAPRDLQPGLLPPPLPTPEGGFSNRIPAGDTGSVFPPAPLVLPPLPPFDLDDRWNNDLALRAERDLYGNLAPHSLPAEQAYADSLGLSGLGADDPAVRSAFEDGRDLIYVVMPDGQLIFGDPRITHAVLAEGQLVAAAGEVQGFWYPLDDTIYITDINNLSGHYQPLEDTLEYAREVFRGEGFVFQDE